MSHVYWRIIPLSALLFAFVLICILPYWDSLFNLVHNYILCYGFCLCPPISHVDWHIIPLSPLLFAIQFYYLHCYSSLSLFVNYLVEIQYLICLNNWFFVIICFILAMQLGTQIHFPHCCLSMSSFAYSLVEIPYLACFITISFIIFCL